MKLLLSLILLLSWVGTVQAKTLKEIDLASLKRDFLKVAALAKTPLKASMLRFEMLPAPHKQPSRLSKGETVVYIFFNADDIFKVGKAGAKSNARYTSQHYNPDSTNSNLARSILKDTAFKTKNKLNKGNIAEWMKSNLSRAHFILDKSAGIFSLNLLEAFLHSRLQPKYEGHKSQR